MFRHKLHNQNFFIKNFRKQMNITDNITVKGHIKRSYRRFPKLFHAAYFAVFIGFGFVFTMAAIEGIKLPYQRSIKKIGFNLYFSGYQEYGVSIEDCVLAHLILIMSEITLKEINQGIFDVEGLTHYLSEISTIIDQNGKDIKFENQLDFITYAELFLQKMIMFQRQLLRNDQIVEHYQAIIHLFPKIILTKPISPQREKSIKFMYAIINYVLKYQQSLKVKDTLVNFYNTIQQKNQKQVSRSIRFVLRQRGLENVEFHNNLKYLFGRVQDSETKNLILKIFENFNEFYQEQQKNFKIK